MTFQLVNYSKFNNFYENTLLNHFSILKRDYKIIFETKPIGSVSPQSISGPTGSYGYSGSYMPYKPVQIGFSGMYGPKGVTGPTNTNYWKNGFDSNFEIITYNSYNTNNYNTLKPIVESINNKFYNSNNSNNTIGLTGPLGPTGPYDIYNNKYIYNYQILGVNGPNGPINNFINKFSVN